MADEFNFDDYDDYENIFQKTSVGSFFSRLFNYIGFWEKKLFFSKNVEKIEKVKK